MSKEHIQFDTSIDYCRDGSVKAYQALIYHSGLDKTIRVRDKEAEIYNQKLKVATQQLEGEWVAADQNRKIEYFLSKSSTFHILACQANPFIYDMFVSNKINNEKGEKPQPIRLFQFEEVPPEPLFSDAKYNFNPRWYHKLFNIVERKKEAVNEQLRLDLQSYNEKIEINKNIALQNNAKKKKYKKEMDSYRNNIQVLSDKYNLILENYKKIKSKESVLKYFELVAPEILKFNKLFQTIKFDLDYDIDNKVAIVDFRFPSEDIFPNIKEYNYVKTKGKIKETYFKKKDRNILIKNSYYSLYLAIALEFFRVDTEKAIKSLVLNGYYKGTDKRKGKEFEVCIMTSKIDSIKFNEIDFSHIEPRDTFKYFRGKGTPDLDNLYSVEPLRFTDQSKFRLIESDSVLSSLSADTNLATMDWQDFETLIRDVFDFEFKEQNIEIRNTQHSNDGGIDVVAFNKNPYTGGIILLQAKRYTNLVTPESVRALKGSMEEHKAIRGILVTTSNFGFSSKEFAQDHNITLINGNELLELLKKHGYDFHINLEQAKKINSN